MMLPDLSAYPKCRAESSGVTHAFAVTLINLLLECMYLDFKRCTGIGSMRIKNVELQDLPSENHTYLQVIKERQQI